MLNFVNSMSKEKEMQAPKGFKDFLPREQIVRNQIRSEIIAVFESHGFDPLETPSVEYEDTLTSKYAGGSEIVKQIYKVSDRAGRHLALKYDQTVPLSRVYASNPQLGRPFKRYQIDRAWRDEFGTRDREFWQCDIDTIGTASILADFELIEVFNEVFEKLGLDIIVNLSNRKLLNGVLNDCGIPADQASGALLSLDKLEKIGKEGVLKDAQTRGISRKFIEKIFQSLSFQDSDTNEERLRRVSAYMVNEEGREGIEETSQLLKYSRSLGISNVEFVPTLARGLEYYTGPVFEVFLKRGKVAGSLAAGGRYDRIIGKLMETDEIIPAVGGTVGLSRIYDALRTEGKIEPRETLLEVLVIPLGAQDSVITEGLKVCGELRKSNYSVSIDLTGERLKKVLSFANKKKIPYIVLVGEDELNTESVVIKNMQSGQQFTISRQNLRDIRLDLLGQDYQNVP